MPDFLSFFEKSFVSPAWARWTLVKRSSLISCCIMTESYNDYVIMSSEFEVEVVFDDYGFDIGKAELFGRD